MTTMNCTRTPRSPPLVKTLPSRTILNPGVHLGPWLFRGALALALTALSLLRGDGHISCDTGARESAPPLESIEGGNGVAMPPPILPILLRNRGEGRLNPLPP
jgi:hypothetical protein